MLVGARWWTGAGLRGQLDLVPQRRSVLWLCWLLGEHILPWTPPSWQTANRGNRRQALRLLAAVALPEQDTAGQDGGSLRFGGIKHPLREVPCRRTCLHSQAAVPRPGISPDPAQPSWSACAPCVATSEEGVRSTGRVQAANRGNAARLSTRGPARPPQSRRAAGSVKVGNAGVAHAS